MSTAGATAAVTPGLSAVERAILHADHHRRHLTSDWAPPVTYARLTDATAAAPVDIGRAIGRLINRPDRRAA
jgi:hypothetical protein